MSTELQGPLTDLLVDPVEHAQLERLRRRVQASRRLPRERAWRVAPFAAAALVAIAALIVWWVVRPFIWVLNGSSNLLIRLMGQPEVNEEEAPHSAEELRLLVERAEQGGVLGATDAEILGGVFEFSEKNAREVMTPRTGIVAISIEATLDEAIAPFRNDRYTWRRIDTGLEDVFIHLMDQMRNHRP